jgi:hypothetical protein
MILKLISIFGAISLFMGASVLHAAQLDIVGGSDFVLENDFSLTSETGLNVGDTVTEFDGSGSTTPPNTNGSNGLQITGAPATLRITFLGSEAGAFNRAFYSGTSPATFLFDTNSPLGTSVEVAALSDGAVPFYFEHDGGNTCIWIFCWDNPNEQAHNDGDIDQLLNLAFFQESATSVIALFGDGSGDADFDDMAIRISVVPLPPAMLMFGAALVGLGWFRRRKAA